MEANEILQQMQGIVRESNVRVLSATNLPWKLDKAGNFKLKLTLFFFFSERATGPGGPRAAEGPGRAQSGPCQETNIGLDPLIFFSEIFSKGPQRALTGP